jgi:hypothetical protein
LTNNEIEVIFDDLFDSFWEKFTNSLVQLLSKLREQRDSQDDDFKQQVQKVFQKCRENTGIPSIEEIEIRNIELNSYTKAYHDYLDKIRTQLSQHFLYLDDGLKQSLEKAKSQVTEVLLKEGNFGELTDSRGSKFLTEIYELIPDSLSNLKRGFQLISEFDLSYRGLIQHRIRKHLDLLTPNLTARLPDKPLAHHVLETLEELHPQALYHCEEALQPILSEPSQAAFAMVEEFADQVLRADKVKREWRVFLREVRDRIWSEQLGSILENNRLKQEWSDLVGQVSGLNESPNLQFLN